MATSQLCDASQLGYNHQNPPITNSTPPYRTDNALENGVHGTARAETRAAASQDPFTFYKTYLDTDSPLLGAPDYIESDDDSYTCHSGAAAAHNGSVDDAQPQARGHTAAYKLAVRLANRSNGAPLATIIEHGSYSTLNSHGSLLSVGRFPSIKAAENTSPNRGSRQRSRSLDEKALHNIQEDLARELDASAVAVPPTRLNEEHGAADPASSTATPLTSHRFELQQSPVSHSGDELFDHDHGGVRGFIRGVLQNVRGVSRTRSRSSSTPHAPIMNHRDSPLSTRESSPRVDQQDQGPRRAHICGDISARVPEGVAVVPTPGNRTRNRAISSSGPELPAHVRLPLARSRSQVFESHTAFGSIPPVLPYRIATRSHEWPFSTPVVHAGTRDVARRDGMIQASTSHHDIFDTSARYTVDGVPLYHGQPSSMRDASSAREVFTSQNASFCSTITSSYSGTVLGVDLDLQHDFSHPICRSQSPPTPVWFTPQMAELERQASLSDSPESGEALSPSHAPSHHITSSALTSLLPIAAASGIVRPNYNTPKISFYSPSGNLIQPEGSSPQRTSPSIYGGSPIISSSYYNRENVNAGSSAESLPIRPPLVSMTTLPAHNTPLPSHLRHHHNNRRPEMSRMCSRESCVTPKGPVKGCDGMVRENSLTPRSGVFFPHGKDKVHRSVKLAMHDLKVEVKFYKARFITLAAAHSFAPSIPKGRALQKRHIHNYNTYSKKPHIQSGESRKGGYRQDVLRPLAAHALRVCFCQPCDGAGRPTCATAVGACMTSKGFSTSGKPMVDQHTKDAERSLPNARIVGGGRCSEGGHTKRAARRDGVVGSITR
ncbi:uncharacterized protein M421DRAFT_2949 [Didymella exigua CBS 183.55]|uniref:Uncharacterized protein n=1 Tax=Didymella exigua CBS 183.55 TaxID=1150837 RepID=A0A6A5RUD8_9PLEO|nr:uncharacterized protein M421DRAFT_2949 [Didymella exigua CBS 183.55]KAF1931462.1 hypothetical protein M421DRAFT_2949 [Didymella exigua CBS 183.55]